jgi:hypothetical protein
VAQSEWIKRLNGIVSEMSTLRLDAINVGDQHNNKHLLTAARKLAAAESVLTDVRSALVQVKL